MTEKDEETTSSNGEVEAWGTFEELLLVSAVNRHGPHRWDSISSELLKRCRFHHNDDDSTHSFSAKNCRRKYLDLKRRFSAAAAGDKFSGDVEEEEEENGVLRMVEELRKVRVEELKREVHKHDVSIVSLQMKVKELEDERENNNSSKPDAQLQQLPSDLRIEPDHKTSGEPERSKQLGVDSAEDRSVNESNSAPKREPEEDKAEPDQQPKREGVNNSNNNIISNSNDNMKIKNNNNNNMKEQSSDVQSSASLSKKKRRRVRGGGINSSGDELEAEEISPANKKINLKSQPLIRFLDSLRSHKHGSVFHRRLPSQETEKYRNVVRQHMDLDTVQSRLDRGIYSECHPKFYRDLLLIFTNGVLFYRKSTAEHIAARELRKLVLEEVVLRTLKPKTHSLKPDSEPHLLEPIVKKPRSSTTMVVCRRRNPSSIQALSENMKKDQDLNNVNRIGTINHDSGSKVANGRDEKSNASTLHLKKVDSSSKNVNTFASKEEKEGDKGVGDVNSKKLPSKERSSLGVGAVGLSSNNSKKIIKKEGSNKEEKLGNNKEENSNSEGEKAEKIEKKKIVNEQNQKQEKGTPILKKPGVANFLERMKQNSPEKTKKDEEEDEDEAEELKRRGKIDGDSRNHGKKGGGGSKRNNVNNRDVEASVTRRTSGRREEKEATASGRSTGRPPKRKAAMMGGNTPDSARGGRSGGRDGGEKSKKKPRR